MINGVEDTVNGVEDHAARRAGFSYRLCAPGAAARDKQIRARAKAGVTMRRRA